MRRLGKAGRRFMEDVVYASLGAKSGLTKTGPLTGLDNAVLMAGRGRVMIVTVDPVSAIPAIGADLSAWLSVHLVASDYTTSGTAPEFATFSYNFPVDMPDSDAAAYVRSVGRACRDLGVEVVAGHTGSYPGSGYTVIGAGTMFGFPRAGSYVEPTMVRDGDRILVTKHAAIEAAASLAGSFPEFTEARAGRRAARAARAMLRLCSTVRDASVAAGIGLRKDGVTAMHDATEGGVLGALAEMASASGKAFSVDSDSIPVSAPARGVCRAFGIDPLTSLGEGALLITCVPDRVGSLKDAMEESRIQATEIGSVGRGEGLWVSGGGRKPKLVRPGPDGYWRAYLRSTRMGLR